MTRGTFPFIRTQKSLGNVRRVLEVGRAARMIENQTRVWRLCAEELLSSANQSGPIERC